MPNIQFDRFYGYGELTELLQEYTAEFPELVSMDSLGKSHEGRDIWLMSVTDHSTGVAASKPAFWCDGNIHAVEVSASTAVLHILHTLVSDPSRRETLRRHAFYLVPRLNPDGAEWALETPSRVIRSSTRAYPYDEEDVYGLERKDLDGDGRILSIRIPDANGPWTISEKEPRILRRREPGEFGGSYYRLVPEGVFHNFDGLTMRVREIPQRLDMNRNFPIAWRQEHEQRGAGPFPTSEPEIRAVVQAIVERPNICGAVTFHTFSGVHLRPPSRMPDDDLPPEDIWAYKTLGDKGFEITGYPAISNYHEFRYHPKEVISGVFDDWMYEHRGVYAWTTEIWSPQRRAGITDYKYIDWFRDHPHEDDIKLLKWSDEQLDGRGHIDWKPFDHPQLGAVEIGGWDTLYAFANPPASFLEAEVKSFVDWIEWQAKLAPRLGHRKTQVDSAGEGTKKVRVAIQNEGWLPTHVTHLAKKRGLVRGVIAEIFAVSENGGVANSNAAPEWLVSGEIRQDKGQLRGWSQTSPVGYTWHMDETDDVAVFEWVVRSSGTYQIDVHHERAGKLAITVET
jgi:murein tripeptide amidase MpaA